MFRNKYVIFGALATLLIVVSTVVTALVRMPQKASAVPRPDELAVTSDAVQGAITVARAKASAPQAAIVEDGVVTIAEYQSASTAAHDCVISKVAGVQSFGPRTSPTDDVEWTYRIAGDDADTSAALGGAIKACADTYVSQVQEVWDDQHVPVGSERAAMVSDFAACAQRVGVAVDPQASLLTIAKAFQSDVQKSAPSSDCMAQYARLFIAPRS